MTLDKQQVVVTGLRNDGYIEVTSRCRTTRVLKQTFNRTSIRYGSETITQFVFVNKNGTIWVGDNNKFFSAKHTNDGRLYLKRAATQGY